MAAVERAAMERTRRAVAASRPSRSSVRQERSARSAADLVAGFAAAQILGGKKVGVDEIGDLIKSLGLRGTSAADALRTR